MPKLFKGLDANFQCRGFQFEVGKTYETPNAELCTTGFHACENPIDVLTYYPPCTSRYAEVELDGISDQRKQDSKRVGTKITIVRELSIREYIDVCGKWFASQKLEKQASGNSGHAQASGNYGHAQASGNSSVAVSLGIKGTATASGNCKFIVLGDWRDGELVDVKVGRVGESIESGKSYRVTDGEFEEAK